MYLTYTYMYLYSKQTYRIIISKKLTNVINQALAISSPGNKFLSVCATR